MSSKKALPPALAAITQDWIERFEAGDPYTPLARLEQDLLRPAHPETYYEAIGEALYEGLGRKAVRIANTLCPMKYEGSYLISAAILGGLARADIDYACFKTRDYIQWAGTAPATEIFSRRVYPAGLAQHYDRTLAHLQAQARHPNPWIRYAVISGIQAWLNTEGEDASLRPVVELVLLYGGEREAVIQEQIGHTLRRLSQTHPAWVDAFHPHFDPVQHPWIHEHLYLDTGAGGPA